MGLNTFYKRGKNPNYETKSTEVGVLYEYWRFGP